MRVIKKSEVRKIIIGHVELTLIFLFDYLLCKIAILESLKVLFLDKKTKTSVSRRYSLYVCKESTNILCNANVIILGV